MQNPTNCDRCKKSLVDDPWTQVLRDGELLETLCKMCESALLRKEFQKDGILTTRLLTDATLKAVCYPLRAVPVDYQVYYQSVALEAVMKVFETDVWFGGLQEIVRKSSSSMSVPVADDFKFFTRSTAGRTLIQFADKDGTVMFITEEASPTPRMGLQSIRATLADAVNLTVRAMGFWRDGARPVEDREVSIG